MMARVFTSGPTRRRSLQLLPLGTPQSCLLRFWLLVCQRILFFCTYMYWICMSQGIVPISNLQTVPHTSPGPALPPEAQNSGGDVGREYVAFERYFLAAVRRMNGACRRLGYPESLCSSLPVSWSEKHRYMTRNSKTKGRTVGSVLEVFRIHVWRVPYEACIPLRYEDPIHRLNQQIKNSIPGTMLLAGNRPQPNLRKRWHRALVKTLGHLGNVQPTADSLLMDASLLLNCRVAAENGSCSQSERRRVA